MSEFRNRQGKPITVLEWQRLFDDANYRAVSNDLLEEGLQVSTFWIGLADAAGHAAKPLFETLVFGGEHDHRKRTYSTLADAIRGHREIVDKLRGSLPREPDASTSRDRIVRHPIRPWVQSIAGLLSERLRTDARLEVIAGAKLLSEGRPLTAGGEADLRDASKLSTAPIDLLVRENTPHGSIPRVAIQCVSGSATSNEMRAYDESAARLRGRCPGLRNGLLIRNVGHIPWTMIQHGSHFDFIAAWDVQSPAEGHSDLVTVLLDEVQSSRVVGSLISGRRDRKKSTLIHRPMFLPGNQ